MFSADTLIISRSAVRTGEVVPVTASSEGHVFSLGLRDCYSGCGQERSSTLADLLCHIAQFSEQQHVALKVGAISNSG